MATIDVSVASSTDDGHESATDTTDNAASSASIDTTGVWLFTRFNGITIPAGATITAAYLSFSIDGPGQDEPDVVFYGEDSATPATLTAGLGNSNISNRARTTASVDWANTNLGAPAVFNTPDLSTIVQELVDSYAPYSSGDMAFVATTKNGTATRDLNVAMWDHATSAAPALHIEYTEAGGATVARVHTLTTLGVQ